MFIASFPCLAEIRKAAQMALLVAAAAGITIAGPFPVQAQEAAPLPSIRGPASVADIAENLLGAVQVFLAIG